MPNFLTLARLAHDSYEEAVTNNIGSYLPFPVPSLSHASFDVDTSTGFTAHSYYSAVDTTLVIAYAGTTPTSLSDLAADVALANDGEHPQFDQAVAFANTVINAAVSMGTAISNIIYTGHSLGGYLAQLAITQIENPLSSAVVFNAPGMGGFDGFDPDPSHGDLRPSADVSYVYSNAIDWGDAGTIHFLGELIGEDIYFARFAGEHTISDIDVPNDLIDSLIVEDALNQEEYTQYLTDLMLAGQFSISQLFTEGRQLFTPDLRSDVFFDAAERAEMQCFPASTPITLADGSTKPIEHITPADTVMSFDVNGTLTTGHVTQLLPSITTEWLVLSNGTTVTPGHRYLRPDGSFMEIADIIALDGRIVEADGSVITVTAERVVYSDATAHLYEQGEQVMYASAGSSALAPEIKTGWKTYNFTVAEHHTYIADGIRVHNDSILSTLQEGDTLVALNDDLTDAAVLRDVGKMEGVYFVATPDGTADFVTLDGYRRNGEATKIALERVYAWDAAFDDLTDLNTTNDSLAARFQHVISQNPVAASNIYDPGLNNKWNDGLWGDDIEEAFFDDVLPPELQLNPAGGATPVRSIIDGQYHATFFADIDITSHVASGNVTASQDLLDAIKAAAVTPADAVAMTAWMFGIEVGTLAYTIMLGALDDTFDDVVNTISGTSDDDTLTGTEYADDISGGDGDDLIHGQGGDDTLNGGVGNDTLYGDAGDDTVDGGAGDDVVRGGDGADLLFGREGADTLAGNSGNDRLFGGGQNDLLFGGDGDDELNGGSNNDTLYGGADNDVLNGDDGNDIADGGDGDDVVYGGAGNDTLYGGAGDDIVDGGDGDDVVRGGDGADMLFGRAGADTLAGNYLDDRLFGGGQNDRLFGGGGDDELHGGSNDDILSGGYGSDSLTGDSGADTFLFETSTGTDTVQDFEDGTDVIQYQGGAFADLTIVAAGDDVDITGANGGHMILLNTDLALVTVDDFVF